MDKSRYPLIFSMILTLFTLYVLLDTFIIPTSHTPVQAADVKTAEIETSSVVRSSSEASSISVKDASEKGEAYTYETQNTHITENSESNKGSESISPETEETILDKDSEYYYSDTNITIAINTLREHDTDIYVAEVLVSDPDHIKTALANNTYGKNIKKKTSEIAESVCAIFAVNGDFYGAQEKGYVIRNGILYRSSAKKDQEDLVILKDGSFMIINESEVTV